MSVQVRRRREAAAFLSTFVGAQGELLVDTTNNRVQVHDGTTAGGWPAARLADLANRNALVNGNFAINQRVYASGTALSAGAYAHDRWKAGSGGCTYTFTQAVPDTTITITAGTLIQAVEPANAVETAYVLSWIGTATARVWQGSGSGTFSIGSPTSTPLDGTKNCLVVTGLAIGTVTCIEFSTGSLGTVQFETMLPNVGPTNFERRPFAEELLLGNRFFQNVYAPALAGAVINSTSILLAGSAVSQMRSSPTVTLQKTSVAAGSYELLIGGSWITATFTLGGTTLTGSAIHISLSGFSGLTPGQTVVWNSNALLCTMSAEI